MNITVVGLGYVGSTYAILLSKKNAVIALDKNEERVESMKSGRSPIGSALMEEMLRDVDLNITVTSNSNAAYANADYIVIATNTELNPETGVLNTSSIESAMRDICECRGGKNEEKAPVIVLRSTVATGFTADMQKNIRCSSLSFARSSCAKKQRWKMYWNRAA